MGVSEEASMTYAKIVNELPTLTSAELWTIRDICMKLLPADASEKLKLEGIDLAQARATAAATPNAQLMQAALQQADSEEGAEQAQAVAQGLPVVPEAAKSWRIGMVRYSIGL